MDMIQAPQLALRPVLFRGMFKQARALGVAARDLQHQPIALRHDHIGRPDLHVDGVDLAGLHGRHVRRQIVAVRVPRHLVARGRAAQLAQAHAQPALRDRHGVADRAGVQDLLAAGVEVAQREE